MIPATLDFEISDQRRNGKRMGTSAQPPRVLSVTSGKGGVGKTHTTVNVGLALAKEGKRVLLLDADLGLANINILLGFRPTATLQDVLSGKATLDDILVRYRERLHVIPAASGVAELTNLAPDEQRVLLEALEHHALDYDYLLVDTAAGIGDNVLYFNTAAESVLVVVDPEPTSLTDAYALMKVLSQQHGVKEFDIIVNQAPVGTDGRNTFSQLVAVTDRFLKIRLHFLGSIAEDSSVPEAVIQQKPCLELFPSAKASRDYIKLAKKIIDSGERRTNRGGLQFFFRSLIEHA